jgi:hypothetical protein
MKINSYQNCGSEKNINSGTIKINSEIRVRSVFVFHGA